VDNGVSLAADPGSFIASCCKIDVAPFVAEPSFSSFSLNQKKFPGGFRLEGFPKVEETSSASLFLVFRRFLDFPLFLFSREFSLENDVSLLDSRRTSLSEGQEGPF